MTISEHHLPTGTRFDTPFESGCVVTEPPTAERWLGTGGFLALDSEGVECQFHVSMVEWVHRTSTKSAQ